MSSFELKNRCLNETGLSARYYILSALHTRISSGLELGEQAPVDLGMRSPSDAWNNANHFLDKIAHEDPNKALALAIDFLDCRNEDPNLESWMSTSGLYLLGLPELTHDLLKYVDHDSESNKLISILEKLMGTNIAHLTENKHFDGNPLGYSVLQAIYICLGLKDCRSDQAQRLFQVANKRRANDDVVPAYKIVSGFSDCRYLKNRFEN